jgi:hypothetical protein
MLMRFQDILEKADMAGMQIAMLVIMVTNSTMNPRRLVFSKFLECFSSQYVDIPLPEVSVWRRSLVVGNSILQRQEGGT